MLFEYPSVLSRFYFGIFVHSGARNRSNEYYHDFALSLSIFTLNNRSSMLIIEKYISYILYYELQFLDKKEYIWLSPMTKALHQQKKSKKRRDTIRTSPKTLITQQLQTDLGRSVGVAAITPLVWLNRCTSAQPSH